MVRLFVALVCRPSRIYASTVAAGSVVICTKKAAMRRNWFVSGVSIMRRNLIHAWISMVTSTDG